MHKSSYTEEITLDVACRDSVVTVRAKQSDNIARMIDAVLFDSRDNSYWYQPEGTAELRVQRPDGVLVTVECMIMHLGDEGKEVTHYGAYLTSDMLAVAGRARADIRVMRETSEEGTQKVETISAGLILEVIPSAHGYIGSGYVSDTVNIEKLNASEYASIPHSTNTLYIVTSQDGSVRQYLGDVEINSGGGGNAPSEAVVFCEPAPETVFAEIGTINVNLSNTELWEQGTIYVDTGIKVDNNTGIRLKNPVELNNTPTFVIVTAQDTSDSDLEWSFVFYDENNNFISSSTALSWKTSGELIKSGISKSAKYVNIVLNRSSGLSPADLKSCYFKYNEEV